MLDNTHDEDSGAFPLRAAVQSLPCPLLLSNRKLPIEFLMNKCGKLSLRFKSHSDHLLRIIKGPITILLLLLLNQIKSPYFRVADQCTISA